MTQKIYAYLQKNTPPTPVLLLDLACVKKKVRDFQKNFSTSRIYYAVKANPEREVLRLLADSGCCFDCASYEEVALVLSLDISPERLCYGNTIKKEKDIARAYARGVRHFSFDCLEELTKIARSAPGSYVLCRLLSQGIGASWPLGYKFGCSAEEAVTLLCAAKDLGLIPYAVAFHVGSQQKELYAWDTAIAQSARVFTLLQEQGILLEMINLGGGFPAVYEGNEPGMDQVSQQITKSLMTHFQGQPPKTCLEPGRLLVADSGVILTEVVLISQRAIPDEPRWVYLDIGKFNGLAETFDEAIRYPISRLSSHFQEDAPEGGRDATAMIPSVVAGPTCDSVDTLYRHHLYQLPAELQIGDYLLIHQAGAYTASYSSVGFNGFPPLRVQVVS